MKEIETKITCRCVFILDAKVTWTPLQKTNWWTWLLSFFFRLTDCFIDLSSLSTDWKNAPKKPMTLHALWLTWNFGMYLLPQWRRRRRERLGRSGAHRSSAGTGWTFGRLREGPAASADRLRPILDGRSSVRFAHHSTQTWSRYRYFPIDTLLKQTIYDQICSFFFCFNEWRVSVERATPSGRTRHNWIFFLKNEMRRRTGGRLNERMCERMMIFHLF